MNRWEMLVRCTVFGTLIFLVSNSRGDSASPPQLHCTCVVGTSACPLKKFDEIAGKPRHDWRQQFTPPSADNDTPHTRALACWRKRDADKLGDGLCCSLDGNENDADRYFHGDVEMPPSSNPLPPP
jgi:hypothetical protein